MTSFSSTLFPPGRSVTRALYLPALLGALFLIARVSAAANITIWDTGTPLSRTINLGSRAGWKPVPSDLLDLETDPAKAKSDPGYYGREYFAAGDVVVENSRLTAVFSQAQGRVVLFSKSDAPGLTAKEFGGISPLPSGAGPAKLGRVRILRDADDEAILEANFADETGAVRSMVFSFDKSEITAVKPGAEMKGVRLSSPLDYVTAPSFVADDLVLAPAQYPSDNTLSVPAENVVLGLLHGGDGVVTMTWPEGKQQLKLALGTDSAGIRAIESIDFENDGKPFYLAALRTPGLWRREVLTRSYLEKQVTSDWRRPFPAKWKAQLFEGDTRTTFAFRDTPQEVWRGVQGSFPYPVWFDGDKANFHLSKKIPPKGEALVYFVEGQDTPAGVRTPVDVMKATLGLQFCDTLLDPAGRELRTHHRRGAAGVHRACTCGCTEAIQAVFEAREEVEKREYISGAVDDMIYFIQRHLARIDEYRRFADETTALLQARGNTSPSLKAFAEELETITSQIPQEYSVQKENMKSLAYADDLARQTLALASHKDPKNRVTYASLLEEWRGMGGAQDYVLAKCHVITRKLYQEAGYGCVTRPDAVELAREIRSRCRQCLRNPDGYEIWPDY